MRKKRRLLGTHDGGGWLKGKALGGGKGGGSCKRLRGKRVGK